MKSISIVLLLAVFMSNAACSQKIAADKVPASVIDAFKAKFPTAANTSWEMEKNNEYEAAFKLNGEEMSACFGNTGNWLETETEIKVSALPASVQQALRKDFADFKISEASKIESAKIGSCFEAEIKKDKEVFDVLFKADGTFISKIKADKEDDDKD